MFLVLIIFSILSEVVVDAYFGIREWLHLNDFSGTKRRKRYLAEAPDSFKSDGIRVVLDASKDTMLLYDEHGFTLKNRVTKKTGSVLPKDLRRFARRGMKGLRLQSLKLSRK